MEVPTWTLEQEQEQEQDNDNLKTVSMDLRLFVTNRHTCRTAKLYEGRLQAYGSGGRFETLSVECFGIKLNEAGCLWAAKKSQAPWEYGSERPVFKPESLVELLEDSRMVGGDDEEEEEEELEEKQWQRICWSFVLTVRARAHVCVREREREREREHACALALVWMVGCHTQAHARNCTLMTHRTMITKKNLSAVH